MGDRVANKPPFVLDTEDEVDVSELLFGQDTPVEADEEQEEAENGGKI